MKKKIALFLIATMAFIGACKKENNDSEPETPTEEPSNGNLTVSTKRYVGSTTKPTETLATAFFYESSTPTNYIKVDCVIVNSIGLTYEPGTKTYQTPAKTLTDVTTAKWEVKGNNGIPGFTYENKTGMPEYIDYSLLPDTIKSSKTGYTLTLTGLSNIGSYTIVIQDALGGKVTKTQLDVKINTVQLTASDFAKLSDTAVLQVIIENTHFESTGGKRFSIRNERNFYKNIRIL